MTENIAQEICNSRGPEGEMADLAREGQRLRLSLEVAEKWLESADSEGADTLGHHAQYMRDKIEEEYALVCFEMEVLERQRVFKQMKEARQDEWELPSISDMRAGMVSDALIDAFVIVSESSLERGYKVMGALRLAVDLIPDEVEAKDVQGER
jgi:hypothetical protein